MLCSGCTLQHILKSLCGIHFKYCMQALIFKVAYEYLILHSQAICSARLRFLRKLEYELCF